MCGRIVGYYRRASLWLRHMGEMVFVLPEEGVSVEELLDSPEQLREAFCGGESVQAEIIWQVPQFTCEMEQDLKEALQKLGVECAFEEEMENFSYLADVDLFVSEVRQGTRLAIDEDGIEAAAYSYVAMGTTASAREPEKLEEIEMILNRPFLYGIVYQGVYVFVGVCGNP